jgi:hypothetical protein
LQYRSFALNVEGKIMQSVLLRWAFTSAIVMASWAGTDRIARADQVVDSVRSDALLVTNWRARRWNWYGSPYGRPYFDGSGYYYNPPLYYRRIAPGVYYYF